MTNVLGFIALAAMLGIVYFCVQGIRKKPNAIRGFLISIGVGVGAVALMPELPTEVPAPAITAPDTEASVTPGIDPAASAPQDAMTETYPASTSWRYIVDDVQFGCASKDHFARIIGIALDGDRAAYVQAIAEGFVSGQCRPFKAGQEVYVEGGNFFGGLVELRAKGETSTWWTNIEATKPEQ